jgi:uncharacterized cupin superfamily protein
MDRTYIQHGTHENDDEGVEVADDIVGDAVTSEHGTQVVCGVAKTIRKVSMHFGHDYSARQGKAYPLSFQY